MDYMKLIERRHSVRAYKEVPVENEKRQIIEEEIGLIKKETRLDFQAFYDEKTCFSSILARYGKFKNADNYIVILQDKNENLEVEAGYFGERLVLKLEELGLNSCWVGLTYSKSKIKEKLEKCKKIVCLIAFGYGQTNGNTRKSKTINDICNLGHDISPKIEKGLRAALLAPTAVNQQKFFFTVKEEDIYLKESGFGFYTKIDLGIVKYHFEIVTGQKVKLE